MAPSREGSARVGRPSAPWPTDSARSVIGQWSVSDRGLGLGPGLRLGLSFYIYNKAQSFSSGVSVLRNPCPRTFAKKVRGFQFFLAGCGFFPRGGQLFCSEAGRTTCALPSPRPEARCALRRPALDRPSLRQPLVRRRRPAGPPKAVPRCAEQERHGSRVVACDHALGRGGNVGPCTRCAGALSPSSLARYTGQLTS